MKKIYVIHYTDVDEMSYEYIEHVSIEKVAFVDYRAASYFLLNLGFEPRGYEAKHGDEPYGIDWIDSYHKWAEINELIVIE